MGKYYKVCIGIAVILFVVVLLVGIIAINSQTKSKQKEIKEYAKSTIVVRYYCDDDLNNARVGYKRVEKGSGFTLSVPHKEGYSFAGFYDGPNFEEANVCVDSNGESLTTFSSDVILYPAFIKED